MQQTPSDRRKRWRFWVDRGGTFTDIIAIAPDGTRHSHKLLSENPEHYDDPVLAGIRHFLGIEPGEPIPDDGIEELRMGTTVATNALLEHKGEPTLLITTRGFGDLLQIAYQNRPDLFALDIHLPEPLYREVLEVDERVNAMGHVLAEPRREEVFPKLRDALERGISSCAIVFLHSYRAPDHEQLVETWAREAGFSQVSVSSQLSPVMRAVSRGDTTVVDAYLSPVLKRYIARLASALPTLARRPGALQFMQSNGGLCDAFRFHGKDAILSGPAGGVIGMVRTASHEGFKALIGFDMGGTSTDVCHYAGQLERQFESQIAGFRLQTPMMAVHTVAAGGGSILHYDNGRFLVGPDSAGANPGPAAYRRGGPLTVTDCNVVLGRLQPDCFPSVFGANADQPLDAETARSQFIALSECIREEQAGQSSGRDKLVTPESIAEGFLRVAVQNMALAVQKISTDKGYDLSGYTLCSFGGAGGQHACQVAKELGINRVYLHPLAGILSALGMGLADSRLIDEFSVEAPLCEAELKRHQDTIRAYEQRHAHELGEAHPLKVDSIIHQITCKLKAPGAETPFLIPLDTAEHMAKAFSDAHQDQFGFGPTGTPILHSILVESALPGGALPASEAAQQDTPNLYPDFHRRVYFGGSWRDTPFFRLEQLSENHSIAGPAVLLEATGTIVLDPDWQAQKTKHGGLVMESLASPPIQRTHEGREGSPCDPVQLALFNNRFRFIAEQMGSVLERSARSVNIRERLDFSCAIFTAEGELIANAPHVPVHLGSMGHSVQAVREHYLTEENGTRLQPGDVCVINDPYAGGTHLPDITVIRPAFSPDGQRVRFWVAARGHHADIGGIQPGSMPWNSQSIDEEGILIRPQRIVEGGQFQDERMRTLLASGPWPARNIDQNMADLQAQIAACAQGVRGLEELFRQQGDAMVESYMTHMLDNAEQAVQRLLPTLKSGAFTLPMDNGGQIQVAITVNAEGNRACIDFTGSSPQHSGNFNAPLPVVHAAVLYVFRCLVDQDIPLNAGCLRPLDICVPEGSLLNPQYPAAVVAGNVEVSQAIVSALFAALGRKACSQGTMNNLVWGDQTHQYYETLCGGDGATATADGQSAVQTHMTNSRLTDVEVLEDRFPVLVRAFRIRQDSGGAGLHRGGNGVLRDIEFLRAAEASILSNHRKLAPFGLAGGQPGQPGRNRLIRRDGREEVLNGTAGCTLEPGDRLIIETPGGGGFGC